jgi:hypothetical protein
MRQLVRQCGIVMVEAGEQMGGRHCDPVDAWLIVGFGTGIAQTGRNGCEEAVQFSLAPCGFDQI